MTTVKLRNLRKEFDDVTAVDGIDLTVQDGEFLAIVGPSGCGKSTLLRTIAGLEYPTDGEIHLGGRRVDDSKPADRDVAMVFQNYGLYPHMSAKRNMTFGARSASGLPEDEIATRADEAAETLDIADLLDRRPAELSGGEQQRVAMGRALVRDPAVLLLDEPLSNLDAQLRDQMRAELMRLHEELQRTTFYVTHDQTEAMTLGDRIAVMRDGQIQQVGPPQEIYDYPANSFVAEFIGSPSMNMLPVDISERAGGYTAHADGFTIPLPDGNGLDAAADRSVQLGIRPEDLSLVDGETERSFTARITLIESKGHSTVIFADVGDRQVLVETEPRRDCSTGELVTIQLAADRIHLFDAGTQDCLYRSESTRQINAPQPV